MVRALSSSASNPSLPAIGPSMSMVMAPLLSSTIITLTRTMSFPCRIDNSHFILGARDRGVKPVHFLLAPCLVDYEHRRPFAALRLMRRDAVAVCRHHGTIFMLIRHDL